MHRVWEFLVGWWGLLGSSGFREFLGVLRGLWYRGEGFSGPGQGGDSITGGQGGRRGGLGMCTGG